MVGMLRAGGCLVACALSATTAVPAAAGQQGGGEQGEPVRPSWGSSTYYHLFSHAVLGDGIRFNNPYRLEETLGDDPESLSRSAVYGSLLFGALLGDPVGWQHGASLELAYALEGIPQEVLTPAYVLARRLGPRWLAQARLGVPIVLEPDANLGAELALGGAYYFGAGIGVTAELVGNLFYGAATQDVSVTVIPMLSLQAGLRLDYEVLP